MNKTGKLKYKHDTLDKYRIDGPAKTVFCDLRNFFPTCLPGCSDHYTSKNHSLKQHTFGRGRPLCFPLCTHTETRTCTHTSLSQPPAPDVDLHSCLPVCLDIFHDDVTTCRPDMVLMWGTGRTRTQTQMSLHLYTSQGNVCVCVLNCVH